MKHLNNKLLIVLVLLIFFGCKNNSLDPNSTSDNDFIKEIIIKGFNNNLDDEDNLVFQEIEDLNQGTAVFDQSLSNLKINNFDSLYKWGRRIISVNNDINIENEGDSIKNANVKRTINGVFVILGFRNGVMDSVVKPFRELTERKLKFKRIGNFVEARRNWRLYSISLLDGETTFPQVGTSKVQINKIEFFVNGNLLKTFDGPDFTNIMLPARLWVGQGIPILPKQAQIEIKVYTTSQNSSVDLVTWHWARNSFGFHRVPFILDSQTGSGPYQRVYKKSFNIYNNHLAGVFNGFISASTNQSLYSSNQSELASDLVGIPYRIIR